MESFSILLMLLTGIASTGIVLRQSFKVFNGTKFSKKSWALFGTALFLIVVIARSQLIQTYTEYNPSNVTVQDVSGRYEKGRMILDLSTDGSYTSENINGLSSGTWTHDDWNLYLTGSSLEMPRWIIRWGMPGILPYYSGADGSDGPFLKKQ
jgi:hypothetical protein